MLTVCSVYDVLKKESIFINMYENPDCAIREFNRFASLPDLNVLKNDLVLYHFADFNIHTLEIVPLDKVLLKAGVDVETVE